MDKVEPAADLTAVWQGEDASYFTFNGGKVYCFAAEAGASSLVTWLWSVAEDACWDDNVCMGLLSEQESQFIERLANEKSRTSYIRNHAMLRATLAKLLDSNTGKLVIDVSEFGKPYLKAHPQLQFNLSHSGQFGALVAGERVRLGIDIEVSTSDFRFARLAQRLFPAETEQLGGVAKASDDELRFTRAWTAKEAYIKALGTGLTKPLSSFQLELDQCGHAQRVLSCKDHQSSVGTCEFLTLPQSLYQGVVGTIAVIRDS